MESLVSSRFFFYNIIWCHRENFYTAKWCCCQDWIGQFTERAKSQNWGISGVRNLYTNPRARRQQQESR